MTPRGLARLLWSLVGCRHSQMTERVIDGQVFQECSCGYVRHVWKATGIAPKFTGHDQTKAEAVHEREQRQAAARRAKAARTLKAMQAESRVSAFEQARKKRAQ